MGGPEAGRTCAIPGARGICCNLLKDLIDCGHNSGCAQSAIASSGITNPQSECPAITAAFHGSADDYCSTAVQSLMAPLMAPAAVTCEFTVPEGPEAGRTCALPGVRGVCCKLLTDLIDCGHSQQCAQSAVANSGITDPSQCPGLVAAG